MGSGNAIAAVVAPEFAASDLETENGAVEYFAPEMLVAFEMGNANGVVEAAVASGSVEPQGLAALDSENMTGGAVGPVPRNNFEIQALAGLGLETGSGVVGGLGLASEDPVEIDSGTGFAAAA